jgi:hypothetical protein
MLGGVDDAIDGIPGHPALGKDAHEEKVLDHL